MADITSPDSAQLSDKEISKASAKAQAEADFVVRQLSYAVQRAKPAPAPAETTWQPSSVPDLRRRLDNLTSACLTRVEKDGVMVGNEPHIMLDVLPSLIEAGTNLRRLALARRIAMPELGGHATNT